MLDSDSSSDEENKVGGDVGKRAFLHLILILGLKINIERVVST